MNKIKKPLNAIYFPPSDFCVNVNLRGSRLVSPSSQGAKVIQTCADDALHQLGKQGKEACLLSHRVEIKPVSDFDKQIKVQQVNFYKTNTGSVQIVV